MNAKVTARNSPITRSAFRPWTIFLMGASFVAGMATMIFPPVSAAITHVIDRVRNGADKDYELKIRAKFYRNQIATQLGISPEQVDVEAFRRAADLNPQLRAAYDEVSRKEKRENRSSAMMSAATALVPGGHLIHTAAGSANALKMVGASVAGMGVSALFNKEIVSAQEVVEAIAADMQQGKAPTAREVFMLRVAQDEQLGKEIKDAPNNRGKPFHKMNAEQQQAVMLQYPALTSAVTIEATAVANRDLPVQELMAREPNLNASASRYATGVRDGSFASREVARRGGAAPASYVAAEQQREQNRTANELA